MYLFSFRIYVYLNNSDNVYKVNWIALNACKFKIQMIITGRNFLVCFSGIKHFVPESLICNKWIYVLSYQVSWFYGIIFLKVNDPTFSSDMFIAQHSSINYRSYWRDKQSAIPSGKSNFLPCNNEVALMPNYYLSSFFSFVVMILLYDILLSNSYVSENCLILY